MEIYSMPAVWFNDKNVAVKWKVYGILNGFWLNGKTVYAANKYFCERIGCSERAVRSSLEELEKEGLCARNVIGHSRTILPAAKVEEEAQLPPPGSPASAYPEAQLPPIASSIASSLSSEATASREIVSEDEEAPKPQQAKYPHSKEVFSWFPKPQPSWNLNTTERKHAELLWVRGEESVKKALRYCAAHSEDDNFYQVTKPSDLERKWEDIKAYAKRNG